MATYIMLTQFTEQGIRNIKDTPKRAQASIALGKKMGVKVMNIFWTLGRYDTVVLAEAPNDETMAAYAVSLGSRGNVKPQTMRAFTAKEVGAVLRKIA
jgi:uncharacterized protein with GYD domain